MYLLAEANEKELPLLVVDTQAELARVCHTTNATVHRAIKHNSTTRIYHKIPAKIYKIPEEDIES